MKKFLFLLAMTVALTSLGSQALVEKKKVAYGYNASSESEWYYGISLGAKGRDHDYDTRLYTVEVECRPYRENENQGLYENLDAVCYLYIRHEGGWLEPILDGDGNQLNSLQTEYGVIIYDAERRLEEYTLEIVASNIPYQEMKDEYYVNGYRHDEEVYFVDDWGSGYIVIPPMEIEAPSLCLDVVAMSDYDYDDKVNNYKNYLSLDESLIYGFNLNDYQSASFEFFRSTDLDCSNQELVATVNLVGDYTYNGELRYKYEVVYENQSPTADESAYPAKKGEFSCAGDYERVYFGDFKICDQISASTEGNNHPDFYKYWVKFSGYEANLTSEVKDVKVYKSYSIVPSNKYTFDFVEADSVLSNIRSVDFDPYIYFSTDEDVNIEFYSVSKKVNRDWTEVSRAVRDGGSYVVEQDGKSNVFYGGSATVDGTKEEYGRQTYVPVINTTRFNAEGEYNTYGGEEKSMYVAGLDAEETYKEMSRFTFADENGNKGRYYRTDLNITAKGVTHDGQILRYRVWRYTPNEGDAMEVLPEYMQRLSQDTHPVDMAVNGEKLVLSESNVNEYTINGTPAYDYLPKILDENTIKFTDVFGGRELVGSDDKLPVYYVIRMYAEPDAELENSSPSSKSSKRRLAYVDDNEKYLIAQAVVEVVFDNAITTSVKDLDGAEKTPVSVRYTNIMGMVSDKPFNGLNIVVTTYSDGTTTSEKKMY